MKEDSPKMKAGLEIHQQLNTHKLFCNCPSEIIDDKEKPDLIIRRELRTQSGETGETDEAAKFEVSKKKVYEYRFYNKSCCLVELDEEPPHEINKEALKITLQFAKLVNARINSIVEVMRKTVVDGSNTSGFQRTALIAINGKLKLKNKEVSIPTICLEEDAAKIVKKEDNKTIYNLSRLGIPLIEVATGPDLSSPEEVRECAERIGLLLRSLKVKRGLGTIRQDVNVSIEGGARVEIKGAQDLKALKEIVKIEVQRQKKLLEIRDELKKRNFKEVNPKVRDVTNILRNTESKIIQNSIKRGGVILGLKVEKFAGLLGTEIMPNKRVGTELAQHAKLFGLKGILHSDELPNYGITKDETETLREELKCGDEDGFIIITGEKAKVETAIRDIIRRINQFGRGVPKEVRKCERDNTTSYLRPMPGAARMYPETDIPLIRPDKNIEKPETIFEKENRYIKEGVNKELAHIIALSEKRELFEELKRNNKNVKAKTIAKIMFLTMKDLKTRLKLNTEKISEDTLKKVIKALNDRKITEDGAEKVLEEVAKGKNINEAIENNKTLSLQELEEEIEKILNKNKNVENPKALIGIVMRELRGKAEGKKIVEIVMRKAHRK